MAQQVTLPDEWVEFVERHVRDGGYADSGEVVSAALAELAAREAEVSVDDMTPEELNELRQDIALAEAEIASGQFRRYEMNSAGRAAFLEDARRGGRENGDWVRLSRPFDSTVHQAAMGPAFVEFGDSFRGTLMEKSKGWEGEMRRAAGA